MAFWVVPPVGLIEPVPAPEFYIDRIAAIELIGADARVYLASEHLSLEVEGATPQNIVSVKVRGPLLQLPIILAQLVSCLVPTRIDTIPARGPPEGSKPFLVR